MPKKTNLAYVEWQTNYNPIIISLQIIIMINIDILGTILPNKYVISLLLDVLFNINRGFKK